MSIFAKKPDWEQQPRNAPDLGGPAPQPTATNKAAPRFGIADAIALLRGLPADELVVRVMRSTLASLDVHLPEVIEDGARRQKGTTDRIAAVHAQIVDLERQLENQRREIATLEADLKETTMVRDRLQQAEKTAALAAGPPRAAATGAPFGKTPTPEPITKVTHESFKD